MRAAFSGFDLLAKLVAIAGHKCPLNFKWTLSGCRMVRVCGDAGVGARISSAVL